MAAIEKICEYSGEYPAHLMYGYKRNHIQVMPHHRKLFRNTPAVLVYGKAEKKFKSGSYWYTITEHELNPEYGSLRYCRKPNEVIYWTGPGYYKWQQYYEQQYLVHRVPVRDEYYYDLYCPELPGSVEGHYMNYTTDITATKRKLRNMVGRNLKIVRVELVSDYMSDQYAELKLIAARGIGQ